MYAIYEQVPVANKTRSAITKLISVKYETPDFSKDNIKTLTDKNGLIKKIKTTVFFINFKE